MRRKDREVTDKREVFDILQRCNTLRIAVKGEQYPYVVPVSFGAELVDEEIVVYFHCAKEGLKLDLLQADAHVCAEADIFIEVEKTAHGITARYESVIGFGECCFVSDAEEILHGMRLLTEHYGHFDYPLERCAGLQHMLVGKIVLADITGKRSLPGALTPADRAALAKNAE